MIGDNNKFFFIDYEEQTKNELFNNKNKLGWVEETLEINNGRESKKIFSLVTSHIRSSFSNKKAKFIFNFFLIVFVILLGRISYLQFFEGKYYRDRAENNRQRIIPVPSERGIIFDVKMRSLTKNIPSFSLAIIPQDLPRNEMELNNLIAKLSKITGVKENDIKNIIKEYKNYRFESILIKEDIDYDTALRIKISAIDLPGIYIQNGSKRLYLNNEDENFSSLVNDNAEKESSLSHILGYIGKLNKEELEKFYKQGYLPSDYIGKNGVEKNYENYLRGKYGRRRIEVNAYGKKQSILSEENSVPGIHIKLSIDKTIQNNLERIIKKQIEKQGKKRAVGIVMNTKNGELLALVSLPSFDNNNFSGGIEQKSYQSYLDNPNNPLFNRAISGKYPSGSTIKIAIAGAALEEKIISADTKINSTGGIWIGQWFFPDWQFGGHGLTNVKKSIAWSVNTFYYYIGGGYKEFEGLGIEKINDYLKKFGFGKKLGIDLPAEAFGFLPTPEWKKKINGEEWYIGDTYNLSIGQGDLLVTPLQIASLTSCIANGGILYKPKVTHSVIDSISNKEVVFEPEIINSNFISKLNINTVKEGMRDCVVYGSCRRLANLPIMVAGKTGTAQWNSNKENHAWFTSFAPYNNPEISVTILVEEGGEGSIISVPIAEEFYQWWYTNYR